jgi:hypothetical protein
VVYVLAALLVASWVTQLIRERQVAVERRRLLNAAMARDAAELVTLERIDQRPRRRRPRKDDDDEAGDTQLVGLA